MAIFGKREFADHCGVTPANITYALKHHKLVLSDLNGKKVIDTDILINELQMNDWLDKKESSNDHIGIESLGRNHDKSVLTPPPPQERKLSKSARLANQKAELDIQIKMESLQETRLKNKKLMGETVPTNLVMSLFTALGSGFQSMYRNEGESLLNELIHRAKIDPAIASEFKNRFIDAINTAHSEAIASVKSSLKSIIDDEFTENN